MMMPGREYQAQPSRFGFNGKENDNDVKGFGNQQDYGMRIYDTRIGKFLSVDPLAKSYPWNSTYAYAENEPISSVDLDGLEKKSFMDVLGGGIKKGVNELSDGIKETSKAALSKQTYKNAWNQTVEYAKTAVNDPNTALRQFNKGVTNLSIGVSNSIQSYTSQPLMWALTIPERSRDQNIEDLGYGLWKGIELFLFTLAPEILGPSEGEAIIARMESAKFPAFEGNQIIRQSIRDGVKYIIADAEASAYLRKMGKIADYNPAFGKDPATILIPKDATRATILEEAIHHQQTIKHGVKFVEKNIELLEIQAQDELIRIGTNEGWSKRELDQIRRAKTEWERRLKEKQKNN